MFLLHRMFLPSQNTSDTNAWGFSKGLAILQLSRRQLHILQSCPDTYCPPLAQTTQVVASGP